LILLTCPSALTTAVKLWPIKVASPTAAGGMTVAGWVES